MPIIKDSLAPLMRDRYKTYALSVISSRALPDVRDGLKPVQRRILYAMHQDLNLSPSARFRKSAAITGTTMSLYHPHGDCLRAGTQVYLADGTIQTIESLFKSGEERWVWAYDEGCNNLVPAKAYAFRVGQVTDTIYRVTLSNGGILEMTGNHPVLTAKGLWVSAEKLTVGTYLYAGRITFNTPKTRPRPYYTSSYSDAAYLQQRAGSVVEGHLKGDVIHHLDHNPLNNEPPNLEWASRAAHARGHGDFTIGLAKGRDAMASIPVLQNLRRDKNSALMKHVNKYHAYYKACKILRVLEGQGLPLTSENYNLLREDSNRFSNYPILERLYKKGVVSSFSDLVNKFTEGWVPPHHLPSFRVEKTQETLPKKTTANHRARLHQAAGKILRSMSEEEIEITPQNYEKQRKAYIRKHGRGYGKVHKRAYPNLLTLQKFFGGWKDFWQFHCKVQPFITKIEVLHLESPEVMYDFTVDDHHNMMVVAGSTSENNEIPLVCVHNSSIYEAMVRLAQPFNTAIPLVDGHGNFGSLDGDGAASARYTEARLTLAAMDFLEDLTKQTVPHCANFDHTKEEPTVLPTKLPYLLLNGVSGIAVGIATNIPPHNQRETLEALRELLTHDKIETWPLPDFPTGGSILEAAEELAKLVQEGRGTFRIRGTYVKEGRDFILTSLPPQVAPSKIVEQLNKALVDGTLPGTHLKDVRDESGEAVRLVCTLSPHITDELFLAFLCKHTSYEQSFSLNYTALFPEGGNMVPRQEGVEKILRTFLAFQDQIQVAKAQETLSKHLERKVYLEALLALSLVKTQFMQHRFDSKAEVTAWLKTNLQIEEDLANRIAQMALHQVATLKTPILEGDLADIAAQIATQEAYLKDPKIRRQEILKYLKSKLNQCPDRKTRVGEALDVSLDAQDLLVEEDLYVICSQQGWVKTQKTDPGSSPQLREGDTVFYQGLLKNTDLLMVFTSKGRLYTLKVNDLPGGRGYGQPLQSMIRWSEGESLVMVSPLVKHWHLWGSSGYVLNLDAEEGFFTASQVTGRPAIRLKEGETLKVAIPSPSKEASYLVISTQGQALHLNNLEEQVPMVTKAGRGVVGIKLLEQDSVLAVSDQDEVTVYTNRGTPHSIKKAHLRPLKRGGKGKTLFQRVTLTLEEPET